MRAIKWLLSLLLCTTLFAPSALAQLQGLWTNPTSGIAAPRSPSALFGAACVGDFDATVTGSIIQVTGVSVWTTQCGTMAATQASLSQQASYDSGVDVNFSSAAFNLGIVSAPTGAYDVMMAGTDLGGGAFRPVAYSGPSNQFGAYCNTSFYGMFSGGSHQFGALTCGGVKEIYYASVNSSKISSGSISGGTITVNTGSNALTTSTLANLGGDGSGNNFGKVNEYVVVNRAMTTAEYNETAAYLTCKFSISSHTLPAGNPWFNYCP